MDRRQYGKPLSGGAVRAVPHVGTSGSGTCGLRTQLGASMQGLQPETLAGCDEHPVSATAGTLRLAEGRGQRRWGVRVQVVQHHAEHRRLRIMALHQVLHTMRKVLGRMPIGDLDVPPFLQGLNDQEEVTRARPAIFIVLPG